MAKKKGPGSTLIRLGQARARQLGGGRPTYNPGGTGGSGAPKPLGVPEGYTVPSVRDMSGMSARAAEGWAAGSGGHGSIQARGPRYFEGDEWKPAALSPAGIGSLQEHLAASGLLSGRWRYGIWDDNTADAYKAVLTEANAMGLTADAVIRLRGQSESFGSSGEDGSGGSGGGGGSGGSWQYDENGNPVFVPDPEDVYTPPPLEIKTTNKDDLRAVFRRSIIDTLGQGWSQAQINELVDAYNWQEIKVQQDAYNRQVEIARADFEGTRAGQGGEVISTVDMASPENFLEQELIRRDPEGYKAGQLVNNAIPAFMQAIKGWV